MPRTLASIGIITLFAGTFIAPVLSVRAQSTVDEYLPLTGIYGVTQPSASGDRDVPGLPDFFRNLFYLGVAIAGILAVLMLMWGGVQYMASDAVGGKDEAKRRIWSAILGLILVLSTVLILSVINPEILRLELTPPETSGGGPGTPAGTGSGPGTPSNTPPGQNNEIIEA